MRPEVNIIDAWELLGKSRLSLQPVRYRSDIGKDYCFHWDGRYLSLSPEVIRRGNAIELRISRDPHRAKDIRQITVFQNDPSTELPIGLLLDDGGLNAAQI